MKRILFINSLFMMALFYFMRPALVGKSITSDLLTTLQGRNRACSLRRAACLDAPWLTQYNRAHAQI
jgi:hypothetical protein